MKFFYLLLSLLPLSVICQEFDLGEYVRMQQGVLTDSLIAQHALDSLNQGLIQESSESWYFGAIHSSNDQKLKIFHFEGESCGAYCNPQYLSAVLIQNSNQEKMMVKEIDFLDFKITSIVPIESSNLYLIMGTCSGRPRGIEGTWGYTAALCMIGESFEKDWEFSSITSNLVDRDDALSELHYHPKTQSISYRYDWYDDHDEFKSYRVNGLWKFDGHTFQEINREVIEHQD